MTPAITLHILRLAALLTLAVGAGSAHAVSLWVGADGACTHASVQAAFADIPADDLSHVVYIANNQVYNAQALSLAGRKVRVSGGHDDCGDIVPTGVTRLSGAGGGHDSVLTLIGTGNDVILERLSIVQGDEVFDGYGGGIDFRGAGFLTLRKTSVSNNYAGYGGGINVSATGGSAELRIESGTVIFFNSAQFSGGGVRLWGDARLVMQDDNTQISDNEAIGINPQDGQAQFGFGGGIELVKNAEADIGSPGMGGYGAIYNNRARYGGGIAVMGEGGDNGGAYARLFSTDLARPVRIQNNTASQTGGGVYLKPNQEAFGVSEARLCAQEFRIDGNAAQEGAAIYADTDDATGANFLGWSYVNLNPPEDACNALPAGPVHCAVGTVCNSIDGNIARTVDGQATTGAAVLMQKKARLNADRVQWRDNHGGQALRLIQDSVNGYEGEVSNCVFANNVVSGHLLLADDDADLQLDHCTIANNTIAAAHVIEASDDLILRRSIIDQPNKTSATVGGTLIAEHVLATEIASLGGGASVVQGRPRFVDPEMGNYRQRAASRGVDFAPPDSAITLDFDRANRTVDLSVVPDGTGPGDLGAFERQTVQPVVRNGDFGLDIRFWHWSFGAWSSADGGIAEVSMSPAAAGERVDAMSQCVHLPGPGIYQLGARGRAGSGPIGDRVLMQWQYRRDGGSGCYEGGVDAQDDVVITNSPDWTEAPATFIDVPAGEWNHNTSIEIWLAVENSGSADPDVAHGFFDDIRLDVVGGVDDVIFADGFDP